MEFHKGHILPTIRIQKIEMENFKSVRYGEVIFDCGRRAVPQDTEADILGIYGQNGSGKTTVIEALSILQCAMSGYSVPDRYSECITVGAEYAKLSFVFDLQYPEKENPFSRTVTYSFKMEAIPNEKEDATNNMRMFSSPYPMRVRLYDEIISAAGMFGGEVQKKQEIIKTSWGKYPIGPVRKIPYFVGDGKDAVVIDLKVNQRTAARESKSFLFLQETLELFYQSSFYSEYFQVLFELSYYAHLYLYAVDPRATGIGTLRFVPFNTRKGVLRINLEKPTQVPQHIFEDIQFVMDGINIVLPTLVAGMKLEIEHDEFISEKRSGQEIKLFSKREDTRIPLRDESAGIIKLISILSLVIAAFNDRSITVAIDELDAGVYEYLLGEILAGLQSYGKGQFIFTSHNLRPLEVLKKESIIFTTSNPDNRYIRLKGVGRTNNLRSLYLKEILGNTQDEQIYDAAKRQRMVAAFMKAGVGIV